MTAEEFAAEHASSLRADIAQWAAVHARVRATCSPDRAVLMRGMIAEALRRQGVPVIQVDPGPAESLAIVFAYPQGQG